MERLETSELFNLYNTVTLLKNFGIRYRREVISDDLRNNYRQVLKHEQKECRRLGLQLSVVHIDRILNLLDDPSLTFGELGLQAGDALSQRIFDELRLVLFLRVPPDRAPLYGEPLTGWEAVLRKFPSAKFDVEEAGKCFALNRYTASVFHAMRILEIGLASLGHHYKVPTDRANWHDIITAIEKKVRALGPNDGGNWRDEQQFGSEACTEFRHFKDAWRNHAMHVRQTFDDERAQLIYEHVRGFMAHLVSRLKERK